MTIRTTFRSGNDDCAAWLTLPAGEGPYPVVLLIQAAAPHAMMLDQYERWFSEAARGAGLRPPSGPIRGTPHSS
jgi:hypothetical protein